MKTRAAVLLGLGALLASALIAVLALRPSANTAGAHSLRPDDVRVLALGATVYKDHCAACHGARLEGQPEWRTRGPGGLLPAPPHDESGHTWHHADEVLFRITKFGVAKVIDQPDYKSAMPAYAGVLSDEEIVAALSWIKAQWPAPVRQRHDEINARHLAAPPS